MEETELVTLELKSEFFAVTLALRVLVVQERLDLASEFGSVYCTMILKCLSSFLYKKKTADK
ncbi:hypothetical protein P3T76_014775 [Phytophthora citrophthora]|uniref:Uncharacterized protein n=1 Tax=Phytophthora citrophthora TaxID=4793 RepID=A0AAD9G143_9STRA|nr:hypothetical protein P3T76_014775 [Phytophthora citrophthora]